MSKLILTKQASAPGAPATTKVAAYVDNTATALLKRIDEAGLVTTQLDNQHHFKSNASTAQQGAGFATDTYLAGSPILLPSGILAAGTTYYCCFDMTKTAAGTGTPSVYVHFGTGGVIGDPVILTFSFGTGTAAIDTGVFEVWVTFRSVGSGTSAVVTGVARCVHNLAASGLLGTGTSGSGTLVVTSSGFNSTTANAIIGCSFNGNVSFVGTNQFVQSAVMGLI